MTATTADGGPGTTSSWWERVPPVWSSRGRSPSSRAGRRSANYRTFDPTTARIILIEATDTVLAPFPEPLRHRAQRDLERLGVEVRLHTGHRCQSGRAGHQAGDHSTGRIQAYTKIWAAGVQASPLGRILAQQSQAVVNRARRVSVLGDCTLPGHPEVFVVGDLMSLDHLPGVAEVAMQSGIHAAHTITRRLSGDTSQRPFRYRDLGTMATIARFRAVVFIGRVHLTGFAAWLMWLLVHLAFLTGFKNRLAAVTNWAVAFLGHDRRQRTITEQQVFARTREVKQPEALAPGRALLERPSG